MTSYKNTKRQGELEQCVVSVRPRKKNTREGECETGGDAVNTDQDSGSEDDDYGNTEEERNEVQDTMGGASHCISRL